MSRGGQFPVCRMCGRSEAACKSHIIPKQFFRRLLNGDKHLYAVKNDPSFSREFFQNGIWEQGILCPDCDNLLGGLDSYGYEVLPAELDANKIREIATGLFIYEFGTIDQETFHRFLIAVAWRASNARHGFFGKVSLGPFEDRFLRILKGDRAEDLDVDSVIVHQNPGRIGPVMFPPVKTRYGSVNVIQLYLCPWKILLKVDRRPFEPPFDRLRTNFGENVTALMINDFADGEAHQLGRLQEFLRSGRGWS